MKMKLKNESHVVAVRGLSATLSYLSLFATLVSLSSWRHKQTGWLREVGNKSQAI